MEVWMPFESPRAKTDPTSFTSSIVTEKSWSAVGEVAMTKCTSACSTCIGWSRVELFGLRMSFILLSVTATSLCVEKSSLQREHRDSSQAFLQRIVRSSQAITEVRVGECLDERGRRADEQNRILWNVEFTSKPDLRAGGHFVVVKEKEKPKFHYDEFGIFFEKEVLSPSVEVGLDMLPTAQRVNGKKVSGRLWASYRGLEVKSHIGIPQWKEYGVFGESFSASDWWGGEKRRAGLTLEELTRLKPCQVLTRSVLPKKRDTSQNFFSLPVDMAADGDVEEFCNINCQSIKRVWSSYQGPQRETWLLWCRLGTEKDTVTIRQCVVEETLGDDGTFWTWKRKSPVESVTREIGARHTVSNLSFTISDLVDPQQNPRTAWIHIANPEMAINEAAK